MNIMLFEKQLKKLKATEKTKDLQSRKNSLGVECAEKQCSNI